MERKELIQKAIDMLSRAYAPYSGFYVGAALLGASGRIYTGCNVENASYPAGICAERTAFTKAVSEGEKKFTCIVIAGGRDGVLTDYCAPCGICRQVMMEFCNPGEFSIILAKSPEDYKEYTLEQLLPLGFGPESL